jgi:hypothetical protein
MSILEDFKKVQNMLLFHYYFKSPPKSPTFAVPQNSEPFKKGLQKDRFWTLILPIRFHKNRKKHVFLGVF